jgi:hypothetical protein
MTLPKAEKKMSAMSWTKLPARFMKDSVRSVLNASLPAAAAADTFVGKMGSH